ncbi:MAG: winged helix-turn-helix transcriptional regulator [Lachnospiraceae bacterium]|nr:winged helix-turn-helix transcriptional regulator [Lachnospiraceae bacterium]
MDGDFEISLLLRGKRFKKILDELYKDFRKEYGLKQVEVDVLVYFGRFPESSSTDAAKELSLHKGHISLATEGLCEKRLLVPRQDAEDRRYVRYECTEEGMRICNEILSLRRRIKETAFTGLTEAETEEFISLGRRILDNIEKMAEEKPD